VGFEAFGRDRNRPPIETSLMTPSPRNRHSVHSQGLLVGGRRKRMIEIGKICVCRRCCSISPGLAST
jgi:hypothetical protein